jgi:nicotinamidase-related amidase
MKDIEKYFISSEDAALLVIDIQDRLTVVMEEKDEVIKNTLHLVELAKLFDIPVIVTEQYPMGLGPIVEEVKEALPVYAPVEKTSFDCCGVGDFLDEVRNVNRKKIIVSGMETHVCVLQTTLSLIKEGYEIHLASDAICSRDARNKTIALDMMASAGAVVSCTETILFQILKKAGTEEFKTIIKLIK